MTWEDVEEVERLLSECQKGYLDSDDSLKAVKILLQLAKDRFYEQLSR